MSEGDPQYGWNQATSPTSEYNSLRFAIEMASNAKMNCAIVKVTEVSTKGEVAPVGRVKVQPLVQMVDGAARTVDHSTVHDLPYVRMIGGTNAVIIDPKKDDIGIVVIADRDISGVKKSKKVSPPGSMRKYNIADGIFIGSVLAEKPTSYVRFHDDGTITLSPDDQTTFVTVKKQDVTITPDNGTTIIEATPNQIKAKVSDISIYVSPGRIDLGKLGAPYRVLTEMGPSNKVWAVIDESDG